MNNSANLLVLRQLAYTTYDDLKLSYDVYSLDGRGENVTRECCGTRSETDKEQVTTLYYVDEMRRPASRLRHDILTLDTLDEKRGETIV